MRFLSAALFLLAALPLPAAAQNVGVAAAVNQAARGTPPNREIRTLTLGANVVSDERVDTNGVGLLQLLLADGTAFTVGPNSSLVIDRFVYDPNAGTAQVSATLTKGVFRFIGGRTSKTPGGVRLASPVGTIGIRGAVVDITLEGASAARVSLVFGREVTLTAPGGEVSRVYEPGYSITVERGPDGRPRREVGKTPPGSASRIQQALAGAPGTSGGSSNSPTDTLVADSAVARGNSALSPAVNNPPVPQPRPQPNGDVQVAIRESGTDLVREVAIEDRGPVGEPDRPDQPDQPDRPDQPDGPGPVTDPDLPDIPSFPEPPPFDSYTTLAQTVPLAGATASYNGSAYGFVYDPANGLESYDRTAVGAMNLQYDFGARSGALAIRGFDGRDFDAGVADVNGPEAPGDSYAVFSGDLRQTNADATGTATGVFVNNGADTASGVIGSFELQNRAGDWAAAGALVGERGGRR
jgi:hypothetical protein